MNEMNKIIFSAFLILLSFPGISSAWESTANKVTQVEMTNMPERVQYRVDTALSSTCGAGVALWYFGKGSNPSDNAKAAYALLLTAISSGQKIHMIGQEITAGYCKIDYLMIESN